MIKRLFDSYKYTKSIWYMIRLILAYVLVKLKSVFWKYSINLANKVCEKKVLVESSFWNYLVSSLNEYEQMNANYEPDIKTIIKSISSKNNINDKYMINIWCNIWRWAIDCAINYNYKVLAFEPAPETFDKLRINIALSWLIDSFIVYNLALWNESKMMNFEYKKFFNWGSAIVEKEALEWWEIIEVPVKRFDELEINNEIIEKTRLVIIDVEWFEYYVLKWMGKTLKKFNNINIIVEIRENQKNKKAIIEYMENLWFASKQVDESDYLFSK